MKGWLAPGLKCPNLGAESLEPVLWKENLGCGVGQLLQAITGYHCRHLGRFKIYLKMFCFVFYSDRRRLYSHLTMGMFQVQSWAKSGASTWWKLNMQWTGQREGLCAYHKMQKVLTFTLTDSLHQLETPPPTLTRVLTRSSAMPVCSGSSLFTCFHSIQAALARAARSHGLCTSAPIRSDLLWGSYRRGAESTSRGGVESLCNTT